MHGYITNFIIRTHTDKKSTHFEAMFKFNELAVSTKLVHRQSGRAKLVENYTLMGQKGVGNIT